jgi:hypothetical protein
MMTKNIFLNSSSCVIIQRNMAKKDIPEQVRRWYRRIGAKGGQAGKGTEVRRELMRENANKRWAKHRQAQAEEAKALKELMRPTLAEVGFK